MSLTDSEFRGWKVRVANPEQSKAVQKYFFDHGYEWFDGKGFSHIDRSYLYVTNGDDLESQFSIAFGDCEEVFKNAHEEEIFFDFDTVITVVAKRAKMVNLNGFKMTVEQAIEKLQEESLK